MRLVGVLTSTMPIAVWQGKVEGWLGSSDLIENEAIMHIALPQPFDRLIDALHRKVLDLRADVVAYAELHHFHQAGGRRGGAADD